MLSRGKPMNRTGFKRPAVERAPRAPVTPGNGRGRYSDASGPAEAVPKQTLIRSEAYRRWIAAMPCIACKVEGYSQCAHSNLPEHGKGKGIKASDENTFPLCGPHGQHQGCHVLYDTGLDYTKAERRDCAREWVTATQNRARACGWLFTQFAILPPAKVAA